MWHLLSATRPETDSDTTGFLLCITTLNTANEVSRALKDPGAIAGINLETSHLFLPKHRRMPPSHIWVMYGMALTYIDWAQQESRS